MISFEQNEIIIRVTFNVHDDRGHRQTQHGREVD